MLPEIEIEANDVEEFQNVQMHVCWKTVESLNSDRNVC